ncbi:MAG: tetratricopeptide repeat protein [Ignavibacteriaceae bacterium]|nr:tetratricopeptide repeat protein [Ignavibacteriaceae bacterium]
MIEKESISLATEYLNKAARFHDDGKLENAVIAYRASISIHPTAKAYTNLGIVYSLQGKLDMAIEECKKAIELEPEYEDSYNNIGLYLISLGKEDEAIVWFEKAIEVDNDNSNCISFYHLGRIYEKKGDWMKALRNFNRAISIDTNYEPAQNALIKLSTLLN